MLKRLRKNKKGFTLAELLIVVAIIGVLVAISIPIFTAQLHKSRRATDEANARSLFANLSADYMTENNDASYAAATWDADLKDNATISGQGTTFKLQDGEEVALKDTDTTITLHLDSENGWGLEFNCSGLDGTEVTKWGYCGDGSTGGSTPDTP